MPFAYCRTPLGMTRITEEDGFIVSIHAMDEPVEETSANTLLLQTAIDQLKEYFAGTRKVFDFPMKQNGSAFQQGVWAHLLSVGYAKTISYGKMSNEMNNPLAIRAIRRPTVKIIYGLQCHVTVSSALTEASPVMPEVCGANNGC